MRSSKVAERYHISQSRLNFLHSYGLATMETHNSKLVSTSRCLGSSTSCGRSFWLSVRPTVRSNVLSGIQAPALSRCLFASPDAGQDACHKGWGCNFCCSGYFPRTSSSYRVLREPHGSLEFLRWLEDRAPGTGNLTSRGNDANASTISRLS